MVDVSNVNETSPEANWNRRADRQTSTRTDRRTDGQANLCVGRLRLQKEIWIYLITQTSDFICEICLKIVTVFSPFLFTLEMNDQDSKL